MALMVNALLPEDIIIEILIRTDVNMFPTLRWVCKRWHILFSDPNFVKNYHQREKFFRGFLLKQLFKEEEVSFISDPYLPLSSEGPLPSLDFLPRYQRSVLASTPDGLLLCISGRDLLVCKPTTRQLIKIPKNLEPRPPGQCGPLKWFMAVAPTPLLRFKIARLMYYKDDKRTVFEIFDSYSWGPWKEVATGQEEIPHRSLTVVNGCLCWLIKQENMIVCLDLWTEKLVRVILPSTVVETGYNVIALAGIDGRLGLVCRRGLVIDFWRMGSLVGDDDPWEKDGSLELNQDEQIRGCSTIFDGSVLILVPSVNCCFFRWYNYKKKFYLNAYGCHSGHTMVFFQSNYFPYKMDHSNIVAIPKRLGDDGQNDKISLVHLNK